MKKSASIILVILMIVVPLFSSYSQQLDDHLVLLEPLLKKTWEAPMPRLGEGVTRRVRWEVINEGKAVRQITEIEEINFRTEARFFWDADEDAIGVFSLSSNGNFFHGHARQEDNGILIAGDAVFPDVKMEFKNTFEFTDAGKVIDRWFTFRNDEWKPGHVFELSPKLTGPYLGQTPPGMEPAIFAPGIISTGMSESAIAVAPDGQEIFYTVHAGNSETIVTTRLENGCWTAPEVASFSGKYLDGFPSMHPDGSKLYFHSYRPIHEDSLIADVVNIWYVEKSGDGWSEPKPVGPPINGDGFVCCPSVTRTGTLYYSKKTQNGEKIYRSKYVKGKYLEPEELPSQVNKDKDQFHAVISPDETYLILPGKEYMVSFRDKNDQWSALISLGAKVNEYRSGWCPSISSDGKFFFFAAYPQLKWNKYFDKPHSYADLQEMTLQHPVLHKTDIFWVDVTIIKELNPEELN